MTNAECFPVRTEREGNLAVYFEGLTVRVLTSSSSLTCQHGQGLFHATGAGLRLLGFKNRVGVLFLMGIAEPLPPFSCQAVFLERSSEFLRRRDRADFSVQRDAYLNDVPSLHA